MRLLFPTLVFKGGLNSFVVILLISLQLLICMTYCQLYWYNWFFNALSLFAVIAVLLWSLFSLWVGSCVILFSYFSEGYNLGSDAVLLSINSNFYCNLELKSSCLPVWNHVSNFRYNSELTRVVSRFKTDCTFLVCYAKLPRYNHTLALFLHS